MTKRLFLACVLASVLPLAAPAQDFMEFRAKPFGLADAERLADIEFEKRHGGCGLTIFKEKKFEAWIFETRIGYAGTKGPDIVVFSTSPSAVLEPRAEKKAEPDAQHNAGDRPPMNDSPASKAPSSPAPRG